MVNPLGSLFNRFAEVDTLHRLNDPASAAYDRSNGAGIGFQSFWSKIRGDDGNEDGEAGKQLTKDQEEDLESLLKRYTLEDDGDDSVPESDAEVRKGIGTNGDVTGNNGSSKNMDDDTACCGCCTSLTYWERLLGCLVFFLGGYVLDMGSLRRLGWLIKGDPLPFVATWTLGHAVSICGSLFLVGPKEQCRNMFQPIRAPATTAYLACLGITLLIVIVCVVLDRPTGLVLSLGLVILLFIQCICILWYTASCIPFLREYIAEKLFGDSSGKKSRGGLFNCFGRKGNDYEEVPS